jgi:hypothetical protein
LNSQRPDDLLDAAVSFILIVVVIILVTFAFYQSLKTLWAKVTSLPSAKACS